MWGWSCIAFRCEVGVALTDFLFYFFLRFVTSSHFVPLASHFVVPESFLFFYPLTETLGRVYLLRRVFFHSWHIPRILSAYLPRLQSQKMILRFSLSTSFLILSILVLPSIFLKHLISVLINQLYSLLLRVHDLLSHVINGFTSYFILFFRSKVFQFYLFFRWLRRLFNLLDLSLYPGFSSFSVNSYPVCFLIVFVFSLFIFIFCFCNSTWNV